MRKLFILAAPVALLATPAMAATGDVTGNVAIDGTVAARCAFTLANEVISLGELTGTNGKLDAAVVEGKSKNLAGWCNGTNSTMTVKATPLTNTLTATGFDSTVNYTATATIGSFNATDVSTDAVAGTAVKMGLFSGDVTVTLSSASTPTNGLMVAGTYNGNVQVTLTPAV